MKFTKDRKAFGKTVFDFQNTRFTLADLAAKLQVGWAHLDWAIARHIAGELTAAEASAAKLWHTELQWEACDAALQLHGGAGYMNEYLIARLWRDARVTRIFGGTNEIMKEVVGAGDLAIVRTKSIGHTGGGRESSPNQFCWIPAFAGMTLLVRACSVGTIREFSE